MTINVPQRPETGSGTVEAQRNGGTAPRLRGCRRGHGSFDVRCRVLKNNRHETSERRAGGRGEQAGRLLLNPLHRDGRNKARVFEAVLGITAANGDVLRKAMLDAAANSDQAEARGDNGFGEVFVLRFPMRTEKGAAMVLTAWVIRYGEDFG